MMKRYLCGILKYTRHPFTNAEREGTNSGIQLKKHRARGYRNRDNFRTAILFHCGGLDMDRGKPGRANSEPRQGGVVVLHNRTMKSARRMREFECALKLHVMGHKDIRTTMIYLHVLEQTGFHVRSPLDPRMIRRTTSRTVSTPWVGMEQRWELAARQWNTTPSRRRRDPPQPPPGD